jgi:hypothetical protein
MNRRALFLGIAVGILFATLVLKLAPSPELPEQPLQQTAQAALTKTAVEQWAGEHELVLIEQSKWEAQQEQIEQMESAPAPQEQSDIITIYISSGLKSYEVQGLLVKSGLLPKENDFSRKMKDRGLVKRIRAGAYTFEDTPTVEAIIDKITN